MIGEEYLNAPRDATRNQLMAKITQELGGWPTKAVALWRFESKTGMDTVYAFVDDRNRMLSDDRVLHRGFWSPVVARDEYLIKHLSREAIAEIKRTVKRDLLAKLGAV